jgi:hypothetical protein
LFKVWLLGNQINFINATLKKRFWRDISILLFTFLLLHHQNIRIFFSRQTPIKQYFYAAKIQIIGWWSNKLNPILLPKYDYFLGSYFYFVRRNSAFAPLKLG